MAVALGARLFALRGYVPVPLLLMAVLAARGPGSLLAPAIVAVVAGEGLRLWGVAWIGPRSRTRSSEVGPLVRSGPYRYSRNPLYVGNLLLFVGVGLFSGRAWVAAVMLTVLTLHYHFVVAWEEDNLGRRLGSPYLAYCAAVARWVGPSSGKADLGSPAWLESLRSERSTLLALAVSLLLVLGAGALRG
jgi:protein-S-isoprenylcysteine O-methyltransferase Ste14